MFVDVHMQLILKNIEGNSKKWFQLKSTSCVRALLIYVVQTHFSCLLWMQERAQQGAIQCKFPK